MRRKNQNSEFIKLCLADALLDLLHRKDYVKVTVNEICARAGVGRSTFYRHFGNKTGKKNLLIYRLNWSYQKFMEAHPYDGKPSGWNHLMIAFLSENRDLMKLLSDNNLLFFLVDWLASLVDASCEEGPANYEEYVRCFIAFQYFGAVYPWIKGGFKESPEEIEHIYMEMLKDHMTKVLADY